MSDVLLFLTATFDCGKTPYVERRNPEERRQDYLWAFQDWISLDCDADIVFCENSNGDLSGFREAAAMRKENTPIRFISFAGNAGAEDKGKGYGEIEMLRHAFDTVPEMREYRYILKVSGRYRIRNGAELIARIRQMSADLICDIYLNLTYANSRTVAFKPSIALDHLLPFQEELDEHRGVFLEHLIARCLHRTLLAGSSWEPLPCTPICEGITGTGNTPIRNTLLDRIKQSLKGRIARRIYRG